MTTTGKTQTKRTMLTALIALAAGIAALAAASGAMAQSTTCCATGTFKPPVTAPTPPTNPNIPTPTVTTTIPTTPPPVVVTTTPTPIPRPMPDRPGMFNNMPSDMRRLMPLDTLTSIDRLLTAPSAASLTLPRQAVPNKLENRLPSAMGNAGATSVGATEDATKALENAKPLI